MNIEVLIILLLTAISCVILGVFLLLRNLSMMTDAISHTILLGIVLGFFVAHSLNSPIFLISGTAVGLLSSWLISVLRETNKVNEDAAIGIVFPLFFGIAVVLLTLFAKNVHLDLDAVLLGEVMFAPLSRITILGFDMPVAMFRTACGLIINIAFIAILFKELKISSFDKTFALISGFSTVLIQYLLMAIVSFTSVIAFDAVGSILVIALMIGPAITARMMADDLNRVLIFSVILAMIETVIGYALAVYFDVSVAGMIATVIGLSFIFVVLFIPHKGIITRIFQQKQKRLQFEKELLLLHLNAHLNQSNYEIEAGKQTILQHIHWSDHKFIQIKDSLIRDNEIEEKQGIYYLTDKGHAHVQYIRENYELPV